MKDVEKKAETVCFKQDIVCGEKILLFPLVCVFFRIIFELKKHRNTTPLLPCGDIPHTRDSGV